MVLIYHPIKQLQKLATSANIPYSNAQQLEFGLNLIQSTHVFEKGLSNWNKKAELYKTWLNLKKHFKDAQSEPKDIRGPMMQHAGFHHASMLSQ